MTPYSNTSIIMCVNKYEYGIVIDFSRTLRRNKKDMKKIITLMLCAALVVSSAMLCACNNTGNEKNSSVASGTNSQVSDTQSSTEQSSEVQEDSTPKIEVAENAPKKLGSDLSQINHTLSEYQSVPGFSNDSEKINAKEITDGKTVTFIPDNSNGSFTSLVTGQFKNAAKAVGFKNVNITETDGTAATISSALGTVVDKKSDIAVFFGNIDKTPYSSGIESAQANGIEIISSGNSGVGINDYFVDYSVPINYQECGKLMADWTMAKRNGKVHALAVNNEDSILSNSIYKGFGDEFKSYVSSSMGYCTTLNMSYSDTGNGLSEKIKEALEKDPNLNYIVVFDETMINDTVSAVQQSGTKIKIVATGGSPEAFDMAESSNIEMLVAQSYEWIGYATVDYTMRAMSGSKLPTDVQVPFRIVTSEVIKNQLKDADDDYDFYEICFGSAFVDGYNGLWGF